MADVLVGKSGKDSLTVLENKTQVYGLAGNDTLKSVGKSNIRLIGGNGTLIGGKGSDIFELNYSATKKISAVIEDIDPANDKIIITYDGSTLPQLSSSISGGDVLGRTTKVISASRSKVQTTQAIITKAPLTNIFGMFCVSSIKSAKIKICRHLLCRKA